MNERNFEPGSRVYVWRGMGEYDTGTIERTYDELKTAIVKLDNGETEKVSFISMDLISEVAETDLPDGAIVIKEVDFIVALNEMMSINRVLGDRLDELPLDGRILLENTLARVGLKVLFALFDNKDEIVTTEDELKEAVLKQCTCLTLVDMVHKEDRFFIPLLDEICSSALLDLVYWFFNDEE